MLKRMTVSAMNSIYQLESKVKNVVSEKLKNRNGMEMLQMILIIGIAVVIGAAVYALIRSTLGDANSTGEDTAIGRIRNRLSELITF